MSSASGSFSSLTGNTLNLSWPADHLGWILQAQTNSLNTGLAGNWADIAGTTAGASSLPLNLANPMVFYRLRSP